MEWTTEVGCAYSATITVGTITSTGSVAVQLKDFAGNNLTDKNAVLIYFTTDAAGDTIEELGAAATITTNGIIFSLLTKYTYMVISEDTGLFDVTLDGDGAVSIYMHVVLPNGKVLHSDVITFSS